MIGANDAILSAFAEYAKPNLPDGLPDSHVVPLLVQFRLGDLRALERASIGLGGGFTREEQEILHTLLEGAWENERDDNATLAETPRMRHLQDLITETTKPAPRLSVEDAEYLYDQLRDTRDGDEYPRQLADKLLAFQCLVPAGDDGFETFLAVEEALKALELRAEQTDTASPEGYAVREAIARFEQMRDRLRPPGGA